MTPLPDTLRAGHASAALGPAAVCALALMAGAAAAAGTAGAADPSAPSSPSAAVSASVPAPKPARRVAPMLGTGAAFAPDNALWIVGLDAAKRLFVQRSTDEGRSFDAPRVLDTAGDPISADGENRPKIAFGPDGRVAISYTQPLAKPYTGRIRLLRSADGGAHFAPPVTVHRDGSEITHRFESIAFDARGTLHTLWIDKRDLEAAIAANGPKQAAYRGAAIYRNESRDGGASFGPDIKLADHSCECCRIALAPAPGGALAAMWRHVFAPNQRDHAFTVLDGRSTVERASEDHWALDACPHHGPSLMPAADGGYHAVWFGERQGVAAVRYGRLNASGRPQGLARPLPDERAEHADLVAAGTRVAIVWRRFDGEATALRAWLSADGGRSFRLHEVASSRDDNDHPRALAHRGQLYAVWRTLKGVRVERLDP